MTERRVILQAVPSGPSKHQKALANPASPPSSPAPTGQTLANSNGQLPIQNLRPPGAPESTSLHNNSTNNHFNMTDPPSAPNPAASLPPCATSETDRLLVQQQPRGIDNNHTSWPPSRGDQFGAERQRRQNRRRSSSIESDFRRRSLSPIPMTFSSAQMFMRSVCEQQQQAQRPAGHHMGPGWQALPGEAPAQDDFC